MCKNRKNVGKNMVRFANKVKHNPGMKRARKVFNTADKIGNVATVGLIVAEFGPDVVKGIGTILM